MKPVNCGCGGEMCIVEYFQGLTAKCTRCYAQGPSVETREEAIAAWNRAMSADLREERDKLRQVVYHILEGIDSNGNPEAEYSIQQWDDAMKEARAALKGGKP